MMGMAEQFATDAAQAGYKPAPAATSLADQFTFDTAPTQPAAIDPNQLRKMPNESDEQFARRQQIGAENDAADSRIGAFLYGGAKQAADFVQAPAQLILNGSASILNSPSLVGKPGPASQWVIDKANQFNKYLGDQEAEYQAATQGDKSIPGGLGRLVAGAVPFMMSGGGSGGQLAIRNAATTAPSAMTKLISILKSPANVAGQGAAYGALTQPANNVQQTQNEDSSNSSDFLSTKGLQALAGGSGSVAGKVLGNALSRVVSPKVNPEATALLDQGITLTPGQILGKGWANFEDKLTSVPLLGDAIKNAQRRTVEDFNRAAYARALDPIGEKPSAAVGRKGIEEVQQKLGNAYDQLIPKLQFKADPQFSSELGNLTAMVKNGNMPPEIAKQYNNIVKNELYSRMTKQGAMDGQTFKEMESKLTNEIKLYRSSSDPNDRKLADALEQTLSSTRSALARTNPQYADELTKINEGYANYVRLRAAAAGSGSDHGVFTPAQLQAAVRAQDKSAGKGNFAKGEALMQDLSEAAKGVMPKYPDSGTAGRSLAIASGPIGAGMVTNPVMTTGAIAGGALAMAPYTPWGQKMAAAMLARRPESASKIASVVRAGSPVAGATVSPLLLKMLIDSPD